MQSGLDIIGNIGIINFHKRYCFPRKWLLARKTLKGNKNLKTVVEKIGQVSGELRTFKTRHLAGEKTKTTVHKENNCLFYLDVDKTYFSPRLANERKVISEEVLKLAAKHQGVLDLLTLARTSDGKKVREPRVGSAKQNSGQHNKSKNPVKILVMFAGVGPYPICIGKLLKKNKIAAKIYSNELNTDANKFAEKNVGLNKLENEIVFMNGDAKKLPAKLKKEKFDIILMPRPNIGDTFLGVALKLAKKGAVIFYHGFGTREEVLDEIKKDTKGKIGRIKIRKAGDIAPFKFRWQAVFGVR